MELKHQQLSLYNQKAIKVLKKLPQLQTQTTNLIIMLYLFSPLLFYFSNSLPCMPVQLCVLGELYCHQESLIAFNHKTCKQQQSHLTSFPPYFFMAPTNGQLNTTPHTSTHPYSNYMNVNIIIKTNYLYYSYNSILQKFSYNKSELVGFNCNSHITMHGMKNKKYMNVHFLCMSHQNCNCNIHQNVATA